MIVMRSRSLFQSELPGTLHKGALKNQLSFEILSVKLLLAGRTLQHVYVLKSIIRCSHDKKSNIMGHWIKTSSRQPPRKLGLCKIRDLKESYKNNRLEDYKFSWQPHDFLGNLVPKLNNSEFTPILRPVCTSKCFGIWRFKQLALRDSWWQLHFFNGTPLFQRDI